MLYYTMFKKHVNWSSIDKIEAHIKKQHPQAMPNVQAVSMLLEQNRGF